MHAPDRLVWFQPDHFLYLQYIYHALLKLRAFLLQEGISCYSAVTSGVITVWLLSGVLRLSPVG